MFALLRLLFPAEVLENKFLCRHIQGATNEAGHASVVVVVLECVLFMLRVFADLPSSKCDKNVPKYTCAFQIGACFRRVSGKV